MRRRLPRRFAAAVVTAFVALPVAARAQAGLSLLDDASAVPRGLFRLRTIGVWTRYEQRFAVGGGTIPLGAPYTADSLGPAQLPPLATTESLMVAAAGTPFALSLGRSRLDARMREEHVPLTLEYGALRRLTLSVVVPVVRKRRTGLFRLDSAGSTIGPNPHRASTAASTNNALVQTQFASAATQLQSRLLSCTANPSGAGCAALLARQAEAQQLMQQSQAFAGSVGALYGRTGESGEPFVPRSQSAAQAAIAARVTDFNQRYMDLLATSSSLLTAIPAAAIGPAGSADVDAWVRSVLGRDTLATSEIQGVGDWELGFRLLVLDRRPPPAGGLGLRLLVGSAVRFASATRRARMGVTDMRIGDGGIGYDAHGVLDLQWHRLGLLGAASWTSVGSGASTLPNDTRRTSLGVEPRWHVSAPLALHASYAYRDADYAGGTRLAGVGASFSTVEAWQPGSRPLPIEMRFSHFETIRGDPGAAKFTRDQLEVRIYFQPGRR